MMIIIQIVLLPHTFEVPLLLIFQGFWPSVSSIQCFLYPIINYQVLIVLINS